MGLVPPSSHGDATSISGVTVSGTPSAGEVLTATSASTADWEAVVGPSLNGILGAGAQFAGNQGLGQASPFNSQNTTQLSIQSPPVVIAAMGSVAQVIYAAPSDVPDLSDNVDTEAFLFVTDAAGTNTLSVNGSSSLATPVVGNGDSIDWTGTSATIVGADLSWDDASAIVSSTAGGVYFVTLVLTTGPD